MRQGAVIEISATSKRGINNGRSHVESSKLGFDGRLTNIGAFRKLLEAEWARAPDYPEI